MAREPLSPSAARREREMLRELRRFHAEHDCGAADAPTATQLAKKRLRVPAVDVDANPFCVDRQLADEYERMNLNKNPRFYAVALDKPSIPRENPRNYSSFANQATDQVASSGLSPRARAEFSTKRPAPGYEPPVRQFSPPTVFSVDPSNLRRDLSLHTGGSSAPVPPAREQYGVQLTKQTVTFGHRPGSGGRMYDRLTDSITGPGGGINATASPSPSSSRSCESVTSRRSSALSTPIKTGMSVMALAQLLAPSEAASSSGSNSRGGPTSLQFDANSDEDGDESGGDGGQLDEDARQRRRRRQVRKEARRKQQELQQLERQYRNAVFNPKKERRPPQFHPPTGQSTLQLIDKYRKLAVGKLPGAGADE